MGYWLTVHYPHPRPDVLPWHVYLKAEFKDIADRLVPSDGVLFYELKHHRPMKTGNTRRTGAEGIVAAAVVAARAEARRDVDAIADYADGTRTDWRWGVQTRDVDRSGYVTRRDVCRVLGYKPKYYLRGFGIRSSGVTALSNDEYNELMRLFRSDRRAL